MFRKKPKKLVTTHDVNYNLTEVPVDKFVWRVSVYGILEENGKILVQKNPASKFYSLPGGGVDMGEDLLEALVREFVEETGLTITPGELLAVKQGFFTWQKDYFQNINIVYRIASYTGTLLTEGNGDDSSETTFFSKQELLEDKLHPQYRSIIEQL